MAYKVFTNGSVLQASEINENLMNQSVMVFSNAAARTSAITSPVEGMLTYLEDTDRYATWSGSAWVSPFGLTLLATAAPSSSSAVSFNNVFSSEFQNYQVYANVTGTTNAGVGIRLRTSGSDATTGYTIQFLEAINATISASRDTSPGLFNMGIVRSSGRGLGIADISNPFAAAETSFFARVQDPSAGALLSVRSGSHTTATSYDGVTIFPTGGTFSGNVRIYGVRN